jgi:hypothetical protein
LLNFDQILTQLTWFFLHYTAVLVLDVESAAELFVQLFFSDMVATEFKAIRSSELVWCSGCHPLRRCLLWATNSIESSAPQEYLRDLDSLCQPVLPRLLSAAVIVFIDSLEPEDPQGSTQSCTGNICAKTTYV